LRAFDVVLLGGAAAPGPLRSEAAAAGLNVVTTYGMSETCGGCVYDGVALDGVAVAVGASGRIRIGGPTLFSRYDGDPRLTAEVMSDGWFLTSDLGRIDEGGRLRVLGRLDDVVVSGGVNVPVPAVAERLRRHPGVREAEVLGVADDDWGTRVVAVVVAEDPADPPALEELRGWVSQVHDRAWAPRQLLVVGETPLLANGKLDRVRLERLAAEGCPA
jgi:O-succinylbenzoic acid--CoA ligase